MNRAIELRLVELESAAPRAPSSFDHLTLDELRVRLLEAYSEILGPRRPVRDRIAGGSELAAGDRQRHVELRSGIRPYRVPLHSYASSVAQAAERWAAPGGKSAYVPALNHGDPGAGEYDGFGLFEDLMERRPRLWAHSMVATINANLKSG
jgi:hypothetical protein